MIKNKTDYLMTMRVYILNLLIQGKKDKAKRLAKKHDLVLAYNQGVESIKKNKIKFTKKQIQESKEAEKNYYKKELNLK
ncbi:MAG: hypothetical protein Q8O84_04180 [Nanoarchaeota archaeon]|nr:hypothetical protein [Nanoarchaeota archaeon]